MRFNHLPLLLIFLLASPLFINCTLSAKAEVAQAPQGLYLGVDAAFANVAQTEQLIDNVSFYTNFFIIGCEQQIGENNGFGIYNETRLTLISQYVYNKGLNFIVYSDDPTYPSESWIENATQDYGSRFMGIYCFDEPGGRQLDQGRWPTFLSADNFTNAADQYVNTLNQALRTGRFAIARSFENPSQCQLFTSDYALYWYDYEAGYNTVFAELGLNSGNEYYSRWLSMALCRGAATAFGQNWGAMITYASTKSPYMESGSQLYDDMILAYDDGAKYIVVFDSNPNFTENILQPSQLAAIKEFWQYAQSHPRVVSTPSDRSAYVLPQDFGYGFRSPNDTIWGLWKVDWDGSASIAFVADISMCTVTFLQMLGSSLDIIYPFSNGTIASLGYQNVIYWNDTSLVPNMPSIPPSSYAVGSFKPTTATPFYINTSPQPHEAAELELYTALAISIVAVCIAGVLLTQRRRRLSA